jgi:diaminohydroxyphosphoribosylaminopyrimidine deaminase/5-amino-6-(5-phosphoribosylamino)uracil reductase
VDLRALLSVLAQHGLFRVMIEGGSEVVTQALAEKLVREIYFFISPKIIGGRDAVLSVAGKGALRLRDASELKNVRFQRLGRDFLIWGKI